MPAHFRTRLRFNKVQQMTFASNLYASNRLCWTNAFDVDPSLGSTSMPGFSELATLYSKYRVASSTIAVSFGNIDNNVGTVWLMPTNVDLGANFSNYQYVLSNRRSKNRTIGNNSGMNVVTLRSAASIADWGGAQVLPGHLPPPNDFYSSLSTAGPANNCFWQYGFNGYTNMTNGMWITVNLDIVIDFFELTIPGS